MKKIKIKSSDNVFPSTILALSLSVISLVACWVLFLNFDGITAKATYSITFMFPLYSSYILGKQHILFKHTSSVNLWMAVAIVVVALFTAEPLVSTLYMIYPAIEFGFYSDTYLFISTLIGIQFLLGVVGFLAGLFRAVLLVKHARKNNIETIKF